MWLTPTSLLMMLSLKIPINSFEERWKYSDQSMRIFSDYLSGESHDFLTGKDFGNHLVCAVVWWGEGSRWGCCFPRPPRSGPADAELGSEPRGPGFRWRAISRSWWFKRIGLTSLCPSFSFPLYASPQCQATPPACFQRYALVLL